jgi:CRP/FNR family cyclic AMP-dependent transcriptional regulator
LTVDAPEIHRQPLHAQLSLPVNSGPLTLAYPKWIPGEHASTGPIDSVTGLAGACPYHYPASTFSIASSKERTLVQRSKTMKLPNIFEKEVTPLSFPAGSVIFGEGEKRDSMYVVKSGDVELKVRDKVVETVGKDGFFGEMALVDQTPRSATAVAKTDCVVIPISEKHFLFMVEETPFFALVVMRILTARLRQMNELSI